MLLKNHFKTALCLVFLCLGIQTTLAAQIRIATNFERMTTGTTAWRSYITNQLVPTVVDYFQAALTMKYPQTAPIRSTANTLCGFDTPPILKTTGANADIFIFFNSVNQPNGGWVTTTTLCTLSTGTVRTPLIVNIGINAAYVEIATSTGNPLDHDSNIDTMLHEFVHALGMNGPLYQRFVNANGAPLTDHIKSVSLSGKTWEVLDLPPLTQKLRDFYGCQTLPGLFMEWDGTAHVARRWFQWDIMTTGGIYGSKISFVTLGFLEGTGWYTPNYSYAEPFSFGQGAGCAFYGNTITPTNFPDEYCTGNGIGCTQVNNGGGYCVSDSLIQVGRVVTSNYALNCENPDGIYYSPYSSNQVYGRGLGSRCFAGNLTTATRGTASQTSYCLTSTCTGTDVSPILTVRWGAQTLICDTKGPKTLAGYRGFINCPDPVKFCNTVGKPACPRNCSGRGTCGANGVCVCNAGFKGTDCGFTSASA